LAKPAVRLGAVQLVFAIVGALIIGRAAQVQLIRGPEYADSASAQRTEVRVLPAPRGTIYDRTGHVLVRSIERFYIDITPRELDDRESAMQLMASELGVPRSRLRRELRKDYGYLAGPFTSTQIQGLREVDGIYPQLRLERFYPDANLARELLGRPAADGRGAEGIERLLDTLLAGTPGSDVVVRDSRGGAYQSLRRPRIPPIPGHDVYLTIDATLQEIAEAALDDALQRYDAESGDVMVMDPSSGEILAVTSLEIDGGSTPNAFTSAFEPGSTAKVFTAAALLVSGLAEPSELIWAEGGTYKTPFRTIRDDRKNGWLSLRQVIEQSSNIGMAKFAERLSPDVQYQMLRGFGLGTMTGVEFPSESPGKLELPQKWSALSGGSMAMGYELQVTVVQLAQAYSAIANDGVMMHPALIRRITDPNGGVVYTHVPEPVRRVISPEVARELRTALHGVVYRGGTGQTAALHGYEVGGKTGTAWRLGSNGYDRESSTVTFISLFPAKDPQIVMVVKLDEPKSANTAAMTVAPLTKAVIEQVLAGETTALDRAALARPLAIGPKEPIEIPPSAITVPWPQQTPHDSPDSCPVPDVRGMSLRSASRELHALGLRMRVVGWGPVRSTEPAAGTVVPKGTAVKVVGREQRGN
jgi:cell division protein FtsI (penicillin-binding protein 3)